MEMAVGGFHLRGGGGQNLVQEKDYEDISNRWSRIYRLTHSR